MQLVTRTAYGSAVQTAKYIGSPHYLLPNSTINETLTDPLVVPFQPTVITQGMEVVDPYDPVNDVSSLSLRLMVIGNKGHRFVTGVSVPYTTEVPHKATDSGIYGLIPFVVRPVTNDLTVVERQIYRLRKTMLIDGVLYAAYYARVFDISGVAPSLMLTTIVDDTPVTTAFTPTINNLRPPIPAIGIGNDGSYLNISSPLTIAFTDTETAALKDACARLYGDENFAIVSEIGFCTGVDKDVLERYPDSGTQTPVAVASGTYSESVGVQVNMIASVYYPVATTNAGFDFGFELGATEPLFGVQLA